MSLLHDVAQRRGYFAVAAGLVLADQATKTAAHAWLQDRGPVEMIPGLLNLWYSRNRGGLFGYFATLEDPWRAILLTLLPLLAVCLIALFLARTREPHRVVLLGLALILGGAVGNLIDRLARGEVVDFLDVYASWGPLADWLSVRFGTYHWPTFNLADSGIVAGAGLLVLDILRPERKAHPAKAALRVPDNEGARPRE